MSKLLRFDDNKISEMGNEYFMQNLKEFFQKSDLSIPQAQQFLDGLTKDHTKLVSELKDMLELNKSNRQSDQGTEISQLVSYYLKNGLESFIEKNEEIPARRI